MQVLLSGIQAYLSTDLAVAINRGGPFKGVGGALKVIGGEAGFQLSRA